MKDGSGALSESVAQVTTWARDEAGNVTSEWKCAPGATCLATLFEVGPRNEVRTATPPASAAWTYDYDGEGRLASVTPPTGATQAEAFFWNHSGRLRLRTRGTTTWTSSWASGVETQSVVGVNSDMAPYTRSVDLLQDGRGRLTRVRFTGEATVGRLTEVRRAYDGLDGLSQVAEFRVGANGPTTEDFTWDDAHLLSKVARTGQEWVGYAYGPDRQRTQVTHTGGLVAGYGYDGTTRRLNLVSGEFGDVTVGWETGGARLATVEGGSLSQRWCWNSKGQLDGTVASTNATAPSDCLSTPSALAARVAYTYDARGNRSAETQMVPTSGAAVSTVRHFGYDAADRLTGEATVGGQATLWGLNLDGTRATQRRYSTWTDGTDGALQVAGTATQALSYAYDIGTGALKGVTGAVTPGAEDVAFVVDAEGRRTRQTAASGVTAYEWDGDSRLVRVTTSSAVTDIQYDGPGMRRRSTTTAPGDTIPNDTREWLWGGESGEEEVTEALGPGPGPAVTHQGVVHVGGYRLAQGSTRVATDGLGSAIASFDSRGLLAFGYDGWGNALAGAGLSSRPDNTQPSASYAHGRDDYIVNKKYYLQRWLDSETGVWMSADSVGSGGRLGTPNAIPTWAYAGGSPLTNTDPDGRDYPVSYGPLACQIKYRGFPEGEYICLRNLERGPPRLRRKAVWQRGSLRRVRRGGDELGVAQGRECDGCVGERATSRGKR